MIPSYSNKCVLCNSGNLWHEFCTERWDLIILNTLMGRRRRKEREMYNFTLILDDKQWHSFSSLLFSSLIYYDSTDTQNCKFHNLYDTFTSHLNISFTSLLNISPILHSVEQVNLPAFPCICKWCRGFK